MAFVACESGLFGEKGNGVSVTREIEVGEFNRIDVPDFVDIRYTQTTDGTGKLHRTPQRLSYR